MPLPDLINLDAHTTGGPQVSQSATGKPSQDGRNPLHKGIRLKATQPKKQSRLIFAMPVANYVMKIVN